MDSWAPRLEDGMGNTVSGRCSIEAHGPTCEGFTLHIRARDAAGCAQLQDGSWITKMASVCPGPHDWMAEGADRTAKPPPDADLVEVAKAERWGQVPSGTTAALKAEIERLRTIEKAARVVVISATKMTPALKELYAALIGSGPPRFWVWFEPTEGILPQRVAAFERREDADAYVAGHPDTHVEDIEATAAPARVGPRAQRARKDAD